MSEKRSRKLSRREIAVAIVLIAIVGISCGVHSLVKSYKAEQRELFYDSVKESFSMNETIRLDSQVDESDIMPYSSVPASAGLPWEGVVDIAIKRAELYPSVDSAGLADSSYLSQPEGTSFLLLEVEISNINAEGEYEREATGEKVFNIAFLKVPPYGDIPYFDGALGDATPHEAYCFELPKGESLLLHVGFFVPDNGGPYTAFLGTTGKYSVPLDVEEKG